jgi:hypothetical protein
MQTEQVVAALVLRQHVLEAKQVLQEVAAGNWHTQVGYCNHIHNEQVAAVLVE